MKESFGTEKLISLREAAKRFEGMTREDADALVLSLISDREAFERDLAEGDETIDTMSDSSKEQYLMFIDMVLAPLDEISGRGFSLFASKPDLRIPGLDLDDTNSVILARAQIQAAGNVFRAQSNS